jgi:hypothetical protein
MTFVDPGVVNTGGFGRAVELIPYLVKFGLFFIVLAFLRLAWEFVMGLIFGTVADAPPEGAVYGSHSNCPICGLRHGPNYKGTHPFTE